MASWMPLANETNYNPAHRIDPPARGLVLHIAEGSLLGSKSWFETPVIGKNEIPLPGDKRKKQKSSAHFCCPRVHAPGKAGGTLAQFIDTDVVAYAQGDATDWINIENEGVHGEELTPYQVEMCAYVFAWLYLNQNVPEEYGFALRAPCRAHEGGLVDHSMFGGTGCPGSAVISQKQAIVDRAAAIVASPGQYALQWP